jgi:hypothetical protein
VRICKKIPAALGRSSEKLAKNIIFLYKYMKYKRFGKWIAGRVQYGASQSPVPWPVTGWTLKQGTDSTTDPP